MASIDYVTITDRLIAALSAGNWQHIAVAIDPHVSYTETGSNRRARGRQSYLELCQTWRRSFPDGGGTIRAIAVDDTTVVQEVLWEGTQTAPLVTPVGVIAPSGLHIEVPATLWYRFTGAQIVAIRHHIDYFALLVQLGALAPASDRS